MAEVRQTVASELRGIHERQSFLESRFSMETPSGAFATPLADGCQSTPLPAEGSRAGEPSAAYSHTTCRNNISATEPVDPKADERGATMATLEREQHGQKCRSFAN